MIRWTFFFDNEHIAADVDSEEEDLRIAKIIQSPSDSMICIQGVDRDVFINLFKVKVSIREQIAQKPEEAFPKVMQEDQIS